MNTKLVNSLVHIIQALTAEERQALESRLYGETFSLSPMSVNDQVAALASEPLLRGSQASDLLQFAGTWAGDDFEECLQLVYETRSEAEF